MFNPLVKNTILQVPLSQVSYHQTGMSFKWQEVRLLIPYEQSPITMDIDWKLVEEFKATFQGEITICLQCHRIKQSIEIRNVTIDCEDQENSEEVLTRIKETIEEITTTSCRGPILPDEVRTIMEKHGFECDQNKTHRILSAVFDISEKRQIVHTIPLAQAYFRPGGVEFIWNGVRLCIPYNEFPVKSPLPPALVEEFKSEFKGDMDVTLVFEWLSACIEIKEIRIEDQVLRGINDVISRITELLEGIQSEAKQKSLSLAASRRLFGQKGFQYNDDKLHSILSLVVNQMPVQRDSKEVPVPLSQLEYHAGGIRFPHAGVQLEVTRDKLPFEVGPAVNSAKGRFEGELILQVETGFMCAWEADKEKIVIGYLGQEANQRSTEPATLGKFKDLRGKIICTAIEKLDKTGITIDQVEKILQGWGLDLKHEEIADRITKTIPCWTRTTEFCVRLKDVGYHDDKIIVVSGGEELTIWASGLRFKTDRRLENIKDVFEGNIRIVIDQPCRFAWDEGKGGLHIEERNAVKVTVHIDEDALAQFEKIRFLYINLLDKVSPIIAERLIRCGPNPVDKIPDDVFKSKDYDRECIDLLQEIADEILITEEDLWFRIGKCLVWERPTFGAATYIFRWPQERLELFVARIWISELRDIRENEKESGFVTRVMHTDVFNWKINLRSKIRENCR